MAALSTSVARSVAERAVVLRPTGGIRIVGSGILVVAVGSPAAPLWASETEPRMSHCVSPSVGLARPASQWRHAAMVAIHRTSALVRVPMRAFLQAEVRLGVLASRCAKR